MSIRISNNINKSSGSSKSSGISKSSGSSKSSSSKSISKDKKENRKDNNTTLTIICSLIIITLICIAIGNYAFKNGLLTCDHYVLNTYLYILLSVFIIYLIVLINDKTGIFNDIVYNNYYEFLMLIIILIICLYLLYILHKIPPQEIFKSNFVWLLLIILLGIIIIPVIELGRMSNVLGNAGLYTCIIVIITGLLGYYKGDYIVRFDWDYYLYICLTLLIVIGIIGIIGIIGFIYIFRYNPPLEKIIMFIYIISIISLIIFVLLLLSVHKKLKENAEKCINGNGTVIPNYPVQSFSIIIKIYNIFADLIRILGMRKLMSITSIGRLRR